jgi:hypothetical protein
LDLSVCPKHSLTDFATEYYGRFLPSVGEKFLNTSYSVAKYILLDLIEGLRRKNHRCFNYFIELHYVRFAVILIPLLSFLEFLKVFKMYH